MKNFYGLSFLLFLLSIASFAQTTKKVLFIGNSYTAVNNLPLMVSEMAESTGDALTYDSNTPGGFRLMNHASSNTSLNKINAENWDYVVLQAQSQETALSEAQMEAEVYPYAESLSNAIRANNACSQPMFYMTWGRENGDASNCPTLPWVCTYEGMDDAIRETYMFMTEENHAKVSPAGAVWRYLRTNYPELDLYAGDGSHPSQTGSYAAACAFYTMIYNKDPMLVSWNSTLSENDANTIRAAAKSVVYDTMASWDFTVNPAHADFTESIDGGTVAFLNTSADFDSLLWDFGDSTTSTEVDPVHEFLESGDYTVSLQVTKCKKTDIKTKTLHIEVELGTKTVSQGKMQVYPNPVQHEITLGFQHPSHTINLVILDLMGKTVVKKSIRHEKSIKTDVSALSPGVYFLKVKAGDRSYTQKILKE